MEFNFGFSVRCTFQDNGGTNLVFGMVPGRKSRPRSWYSQFKDGAFATRPLSTPSMSVLGKIFLEMIFYEHMYIINAGTYFYDWTYLRYDFPI